jgi:hypothetical protein
MAPISGAIHPIEAAATDWHYGAYVRKDATKVSRWGMELGIQGGRDSEKFAFLVDEGTSMEQMCLEPILKHLHSGG